MIKITLSRFVALALIPCLLADHSNAMWGHLGRLQNTPSDLSGSSVFTVQVLALKGSVFGHPGGPGEQSAERLSQQASALIRRSPEQRSGARPEDAELPQWNELYMQVLVLAMARELNDSVFTREEGTIFIGNSPIPVEYGTQNRSLQSGAFVRIGPLIFMGEAEYRRLSPELRNEVTPYVIHGPSMGTSIFLWHPEVHAGDGLYIDAAISLYTQTATVAVLQHNWTGWRVIDAGAGDYKLTLAAAASGADEVYPIEISASLREAGRGDFSAFGRGALLDGPQNLVDPEAIYERISRMKDKPTLVLSNLGSWDEYNVTNKQVIELAARISGPMHLILGGYRRPPPEGEGSDIWTLRKYGFVVNVVPILHQETPHSSSIHLVIQATRPGTTLRPARDWRPQQIPPWIQEAMQQLLDERRQAQETQQRLQNNLYATVRVVAKDVDGIAEGTGFIVEQDEKSVFILTAAHCIGWWTSIAGNEPGSQSQTPAEVHAIDREKDLALLKVSKTNLPQGLHYAVATLAPREAIDALSSQDSHAGMIPYPGHSIPGVPSFWFVQKKFFTAAWYASQYDWYLRSQFSQTGKLEGRPALKRDLEQRIDVWRDEDSRQNIGHLWTELDPGETRSGSPLVIPTGFVIGMIQNEHWQIGIDLIRSFLEQHLPGFGGQSVPSTPEGKPSSGPSRVHNSGLFRSG